MIESDPQDFLDTSEILSNHPSSIETSSTHEEPEAPIKKGKKWLRALGWAFLAVFFFILFTLLKLPEDRIRNFIEGNISATLASQNIGFSAEEGHLSIFFGVSYVMKGVTLTFPDPIKPVRINQITAAPSLLAMLAGRFGGALQIKQSESEPGFLETSFSMSNHQINLSYQMSSIDIGKLGILPAFAKIQGSAMVSGVGAIEGDLNTPSSLTGKLQLDISKLQLEAQNISGFAVPPVRVSEGKLELDVDKGKAIVKTLQLGKTPSDDIRLKITGSAALKPDFSQTDLNVRADFSLSEPILKAFSLIDLILGPGKQSDGSYAFNLTGPVMAFNPTPVRAAK